MGNGERLPPKVLVEKCGPVFVLQAAVHQNVSPVHFGEFDLPGDLLTITSCREHDCRLYALGVGRAGNDPRDLSGRARLGEVALDSSLKSGRNACHAIQFRRVSSCATM